MNQPGNTVRDRARQAQEQRQALAAGVLPPGADAATGEVVAKTDPLRVLLDSFKPEIVDQFPLQLKINPEAWLRVVLTGMKTSKQAAQLARCDRPSLFAALLESARYGLTPFTDEAAIVPYGTTATFIPMAQGFIRMFWNSGQISGVVVDFIRKGEVRGRDWEISRGPGGRGFFHRPVYFDEETFEPIPPGEPLLAYCYLQFKDGTCSEPSIVTRWDAEDVMRNRSKAWQNAENLWQNTDGRKGRDSLWHTDFPAMWRKTAVRRAAKYGPKSAELQELLLIEAREDRHRTDAPPPPPVPALGSGATVDYSTDINGGNIIGGTAERVGEDEPPPAGQGHDDDSGPRNGGRAAGQPAGGSPADAPAEDGVKITPSTAGKVNIRFSRIGWAGDARRTERMVVMGILAAPKGAPLKIKSTNDLTEAQGQAFMHNWDAILAHAAKQDPPADVAGIIQRLYDAAQQQAAAGQQAAEGSTAP